jgi:hypothetical protein
MTPEDLKHQEEFNRLLNEETPIIQELNGKKIYFFKKSTWRDKYLFIEPIRQEPKP